MNYMEEFALLRSQVAAQHLKLEKLKACVAELEAGAYIIAEAAAEIFPIPIYGAQVQR